ncbi:MAG: DUF1178 family protein [Pseudomonadota bacterium]
MIVFDLICQPAGHRFEGWFASSEAFVEQQRRGLVDCPHCGSVSVAKAPMAPAVPKKGNQASVPAQPAQAAQVVSGLPPEALAVMEKLAQMQAEALKQSRWVGKDFAETSRAIHYGEREAEAIHGQATLEQAKELLEEGVAVMPLPFPVVPPDQAN